MVADVVNLLLLQYIQIYIRMKYFTLTCNLSSVLYPSLRHLCQHSYGHKANKKWDKEKLLFFKWMLSKFKKNKPRHEDKQEVFIGTDKIWSILHLRRGSSKVFLNFASDAIVVYLNIRPSCICIRHCRNAVTEWHTHTAWFEWLQVWIKWIIA